MVDTARDVVDVPLSREARAGNVYVFCGKSKGADLATTEAGNEKGKIDFDKMSRDVEELACV